MFNDHPLFLANFGFRMVELNLLISKNGRRDTTHNYIQISMYMYANYHLHVRTYDFLLKFNFILRVDFAYLFLKQKWLLTVLTYVFDHINVFPQNY